MRLSETWFIEGYIDFELQKYRLLAYLQEVNHYFHESKLYPQLSDTIFHYNNLTSFRDNKNFLQSHFPLQLDKINIKKLELVYEKMLKDDEVMQELERITQYALEEMKGTIDSGAEIYETVEKQLRIQPIGIMPLYKNEGYMLLRFGNYAEIRAYAYTITLFEQQNSRYRGIRIDYLDTWSGSLVNTFEQIKKDIIRLNRILPNPAVYSVEYPHAIPLYETLLPIAKRELVKHIEHDKAA